MKKILFILTVLLVSQLNAKNNVYHLLIGTYTNEGKSEGIYTYSVDMNTAEFKQIFVEKGISNPSYLAFSPDKKFVYSVSESSDGGAALAFRFDKKNGILSQINSAKTTSDGPCHILATKQNVITANYGGGSISVFGRKEDGSLTGILQLIQHTGKSVNTERQNEPHVHQVVLSPDRKYIMVNDLGTDMVTVYRYNSQSITNVLTPEDTLRVKPGSGPRHLVFSKDGKRLFLIQEIDGTLSVINMKNGKLSMVQETTIDRAAGTVNRAAEIFLSPDEKFIYATNRGSANNISCFSVGRDGRLTFQQQIPTGGDGPRNFAITPDGKYIFVAHQFTDNVVVFKRDAKTGMLTNTGKEFKIGAPVCLLFY